MSGAATKFDDEFTIGASDTGRLDKFLSQQFPNRSRTFLQRLINSRAVVVDGHPVSPHHALRIGQRVQIVWPKAVPAPVKSAGPLPFSIFFEDKTLLVLDKPAGLLCHPAGWKREGDTLVELLRPHIDSSGWPDDVRPGLVHRLDRDTSGVMVYAKTPEAHTALSKQFSSRQVKKTYRALIKGVPATREGTFEASIGRHPHKRQRFAVVADGRWSLTKFLVDEAFQEKAAMVSLFPLTGRTHQLRVQLSAYGCPILGDRVYGKNEPEWQWVKRQMLHAARLEFTHPESGQRLSYESPQPPDFQAAIKLIRSSL